MSLELAKRRKLNATGQVLPEHLVEPEGGQRDREVVHTLSISCGSLDVSSGASIAVPGTRKMEKFQAIVFSFKFTRCLFAGQTIGTTITLRDNIIF